MGHLPLLNQLVHEKVGRRCRTNSEHRRQSRPDSCLGLSHFQHECLENRFKLFPPRSTTKLKSAAGVTLLNQVGELVQENSDLKWKLEDALQARPPPLLTILEAHKYTFPKYTVDECGGPSTFEEYGLKAIPYFFGDMSGD